MPARLQAAISSPNCSRPPIVTAGRDRRGGDLAALARRSARASIARLSRAGAKAAAVNRAMLLRMPEKSETRLISSR